MRRLLPGANELAIFAGMSVICAAVVATMGASSHDLGLAFVACPVFIFAAVLGLRRNWQRQAQRVRVEVTPAEPVIDDPTSPSL